MPNSSKQALHASGWQLNEEECQGRDITKMHHPKRRSEATSRNSLWFLWQPHGLKNTGRHGFPSRFLLAHSHLRCRRPHSMLCRMPIFRQANTHAGTRAADHPSFLALHMLGTRYDWAFQASARWFSVRIHHH